MCEHCTRREFIEAGVAGSLMLAGTTWTHAWASQSPPAKSKEKSRIGVIFTGNPVPVHRNWGADSTQIDAMKAFVDNYGESVFIEDYRKFKIGEKVRVTVGPLKGLEGRIVAGGRKIRFAVGIDSIKSSFSVEIEPTYLEKIGAPEPEDKKSKKYRVR